MAGSACFGACVTRRKGSFRSASPLTGDGPERRLPASAASSEIQRVRRVMAVMGGLREVGRKQGGRARGRAKGVSVILWGSGQGFLWIQVGPANLWTCGEDVRASPASLSGAGEAEGGNQARVRARAEVVGGGGRAVVQGRGPGDLGGPPPPRGEMLLSCCSTGVSGPRM